jgi:DNA-binding Xre family transcriptional regulator
MSERESPKQQPEVTRPALLLRHKSDAERRHSHLSSERRFLEESEITLRKGGFDAGQIADLFSRRRAELDALEDLPGEFLELTDGRRGPDALVNLDGLGRALVQLRIRAGISQRELARRTGVHESQVSRDESGGYANATVGRLQRIIEALEGRLLSTWEEA